MAAAIRDMAIRGAPAIGVAAAYGLALGAREAGGEGAALRAEWDAMCATFAGTRPTAVNLFWAIDRMRACLRPPRSRRARSALRAALLAEARHIEAEDLESCRRLGDLGAGLLPRRRARAHPLQRRARWRPPGYGTALGVIRSAARIGKLNARVRRRDAAASCRARGSPPGSCCATASRSRCSPTTWPAS